jgi:peptidoglycan/xylan/chitin deacetylase (PgdA/CDA1 family)
MTFRADRFLTLRVVSPLKALVETAGVPRVPILMYHSISHFSEHGVNPYYRIATAPEVFIRHMAFLSNQGYQAVSLNDAVNFLRKEHGVNGDIPAKPVVITFDDGLRDFYMNAFPVLKEYGFSATVFLPAGFIKDSPGMFKGRECLTWQEVKTLHGEGIVFGSHTVTHPQLWTMRKADIEFELRCSREIIEDKLGTAVKSFSYPYAFPECDTPFVDYLLNALTQCGYKNGVSTRIGRAAPGENILFLKRIPVNSCDDNKLFHAKLEGAYDWLYSVQRASKTIRRSHGIHEHNNRQLECKKIS